jgi:hypothetical protein
MYQWTEFELACNFCITEDLPEDDVALRYRKKVKVFLDKILPFKDKTVSVSFEDPVRNAQ